MTAPLDVLVLGGTAWLGAVTADEARARGHRVTCLARSESGQAPDGVSFIRADRRSPDAYARVVDRGWDAVIDVSRHPAHVRSAVDALATHARHWVFVSSISVYDVQSADSPDDLHQPWAGPGDPTAEDYPAAKVACEQACQEVVPGEQLLLVRAGLIVGYGDPSDRFGYWVARIAAVGSPDEVVLVPPMDTPVQAIDVVDLARWLVDAAERRIPGTFDAVGDKTPFGEILEACATVCDVEPTCAEPDEAWLIAQDVLSWSGPESLPLWLPAQERAAMNRSNEVAKAAGLELTPLPATIGAVLAWESRQGLDRVRRAGLSTEREHELLTEFLGPST